MATSTSTESVVLVNHEQPGLRDAIPLELLSNREGGLPSPQKTNNVLPSRLETANHINTNSAASQHLTPTSPEALTQSPNPDINSPQTPASPPISKLRAITVITTLSGISLLNTMGSGILISALPTIARDVHLPPHLLLWPAAVYALAAGCLLLIFGSIADVVGPKHLWVVGSYLFAAFTVGIGVARTGLEVILFRTLLGVAVSMCLPTAVSLITGTFARGTWRNVAFAMNGAGQPVGFALGLVLGGVFTDTIGWRWAYYMMAIISFVLSTASIWSLPSHRVLTGPGSERKWTTRLANDIDWVGAILMSAALGMLLYVLAVVSSSYRKLQDGSIIAVLVLSLVLLVAFPYWMDRQIKQGKPSLIPNKLWRSSSFTTVCIAVFLAWASLNGIEYFTTLYFQEIIEYSALESSLRFLPHAITGVPVNIATGYLVSRVDVRILAVVAACITLIPAPLMATVTIGSNYWFAPFWALLLSPVSADVLFTVSNLVISNAYPPELQSLAGGVFNEVSQFGNSIGLAITAAVAASVTEHHQGGGNNAEDDDGAAGRRKLAEMAGYRAAFWTIFASNICVLVVVWFGFRKAGIVGKKNE